MERESVRTKKAPAIKLAHAGAENCIKFFVFTVGDGMISMLQVFNFSVLVSSELISSQNIPKNTQSAPSDRHSNDYCAMYDICGERSDGKVLNCPYGSPSIKPDELFSAKIQSLCPTISGKVCCTETQFDTLRSQVQQAVPFLVGCPACLRNFLNLFCELSCSPNQSLFINVTSVAEVSGNLTVDGIDYHITDTFGEGLYQSCKEVKFGTMNTRAINFVGGGAQNFREWFAFIGQKAPPGFPGSPYAINFKSSAPDSSAMAPMNLSVYSCGDTSLGCSCGDCPSSPACSSPEPLPPHEEDSCSIRIGPLKVRCIELSMVLVYILLVSCFFGWAALNRRGDITQPGGSSEPLLHPVEGDVKRRAHLSPVQRYMAKFYRTYGSLIARNPSLVLFTSVAIVLALSSGLFNFKVETRPEKLWVGPESKAAEEKKFFDSHLSPFYRIEQLILATVPDPKNGKAPSIVTEENILLLFDIQEKVDQIRGNNSGSEVSLTDICLKPLGEDCATQSILQYFKMDSETFDDYGGVEHAEYCFQHYTSSEMCLSAFQAPVDPSAVLGGFSGSNFSEATAFVVTYPVNNVVGDSSNQNARAIAWEKSFIQLAKEELLPMARSKNLTLSFSSESSIEEELKRESTADVITIAASYLVMFVYISVTLGDAPQFYTFYISSKVLLGLSGVVLVLLSVLGSVGFFSALGVKSTLIIMEVIPFLVLAVGVDNMCILVRAVKRQPLDVSLEERISSALVEVGPSITLASLSEVLAFAVGAFVPMPACRVFSMFAALAIMLDFFLQITAFVALIVFDCKRAADNRIDCFPCIKVFSSSQESVEGGRGSGFLERYMKEVHAPFLGLWVVKLVVVALFLAFALASIALSPRLETGLEQKIVLPRDSYLQDYFDSLSEYLRVGPPLYFVVKKYNYSVESRHTNQLCSISQCNSNSLLNERLLAAVGSSLMVVIVLQMTREKLPWFLNALPSADCAKGGHGAYTNSVDLKGYETGVIQASEFRTYHTPLNTQGDYVNALRAAREFSSRLSNSLKIEIFPYSVFYIFFEQYLNIWTVALTNLAIAIGAIFIVCLLFTSSAWSSAIIVLVLLMILLDLMGMMVILGIQLNAVSVVNLIMSIGIAVEFCVHISHAFLMSSGNREQRARGALETMGASVFSGITLTKLVGVIVLCFARSEIFVVYYFQMYLALVIIGFLHGLVFLPVILSLVGPPQLHLDIEDQQRRDEASSSLLN
ncbi:unnamed protein product [Thlaspi arvense]|uniref:SSD domain-containing protein n=1 Tax=Thlaspi arvense TaxID=13288 RepID=A0AAU9SXX4_THLAR|nr:unnamed protein product [Thlaspi arvense]